MIIDRFGRRFRKLRISLTTSCNYACTYCVPNGTRLLKASDEMDDKSTLRAVSLLKEVAGIEEVRITGGEPLISNKFDSVLKCIDELNFNSVSLTTNGQFLRRKLDVISGSSIKRINCSLDTLHPLKFQKIARSGDLKTVLDGLQAMQSVGIGVKLNMVPMRGVNHDEVLRMLDFALAAGAELRYIELMRMGHLLNSNTFSQQFFGMDEILETIVGKYQFVQIQSDFDSTSKRFEIPHLGVFGIIANETEPFCSTCTRLRLASNGHLYGCLSNHKSYDIRPLLQQSDANAKNALGEILNSALADKQIANFTGDTTVMKFIGG